MPKAALRNLLEDSKKELETDYQKFRQTIKDDLQSFKKNTLGKI